MRRDFTGLVVGRLTVLERAEDGPKRHDRWVCACVCGKTTTVYGQSLRGSRTKSCGCLQREWISQRNTTHGETSRRNGATREYRAWNEMIARCTNPNRPFYSYYGGRGITVCDRWRHNYEQFLAHVGRAPTPAHTLDRINPDGNYEPGNVRWATRREQRLNQRHMLAGR